jgi:hypothetical protein
MVVCPPDPGPGGAETNAIVSGSPGSAGRVGGSTQPASAIWAAHSRSSMVTGMLTVPGGDRRSAMRWATRALMPSTPSERSRRLAWRTRSIRRGPPTAVLFPMSPVVVDAVFRESVTAAAP